jgi:tetratricopeptide (TPR) repeat protein
MHCKPHYRFLLAVVSVSVLATAGCDKLKARDFLNKGVEAYKAAQFDRAIEDFKQAKALDPSLTSARLYLATAYGSQYIPAVPSDENVRNGEQALAEYHEVLDSDPSNLIAIDGIGGMLYNMGSNPFDTKKMEESKSYHEKHIQLKPDDPEPYYWIGVIDYWHSFRDNHTMREDYNKTAKKPLGELDSMPAKLSTAFAAQDGTIVDEGMTNLKKAIEIKSDYDDAMAYLNLLYRQKADMETDPAARDTDTRMANDLVDKVKAIKQERMQNPQPASPAS